MGQGVSATQQRDFDGISAIPTTPQVASKTPSQSSRGPRCPGVGYCRCFRRGGRRGVTSRGSPPQSTYQLEEGDSFRPAACNDTAPPCPWKPECDRGSAKLPAPEPPKFADCAVSNQDCVRDAYQPTHFATPASLILGPGKTISRPAASAQFSRGCGPSPQPDPSDVGGAGDQTDDSVIEIGVQIAVQKAGAEKCKGATNQKNDSVVEVGVSESCRQLVTAGSLPLGAKGKTFSGVGQHGRGDPPAARWDGNDTAITQGQKPTPAPGDWENDLLDVDPWEPPPKGSVATKRSARPDQIVLRTQEANGAARPWMRGNVAAEDKSRRLSPKRSEPMFLKPASTVSVQASANTFTPRQGVRSEQPPTHEHNAAAEQQHVAVQQHQRSGGATVTQRQMLQALSPAQPVPAPTESATNGTWSSTSISPSLHPHMGVTCESQSRDGTPSLEFLLDRSECSLDIILEEDGVSDSRMSRSGGRSSPTSWLGLPLSDPQDPRNDAGTHTNNSADLEAALDSCSSTQLGDRSARRCTTKMTALHRSMSPRGGRKESEGPLQLKVERRPFRSQSPLPEVASVNAAVASPGTVVAPARVGCELDDGTQDNGTRKPRGRAHSVGASANEEYVQQALSLDALEMSPRELEPRNGEESPTTTASEAAQRRSKRRSSTPPPKPLTPRCPRVKNHTAPEEAMLTGAMREIRLAQGVSAFVRKDNAVSEAVEALRRHTPSDDHDEERAPTLGVKVSCEDEQEARYPKLDTLQEVPGPEPEAPNGVTLSDDEPRPGLS